MKFSKPTRILIVDDEQDLCLLLKRAILKSTNAEIDLAHNVQDAKMKILGYEYDMFFFDYNLPDGTGADLVEFTIKNKSIQPHIVAMSADTNDEDIKWLRRNGVNHFMQKPLSLTKISQSLAPIIHL